VELLRVLERAHRQMMETVSAELERADVMDVNAVQALLLYHMGDAPLTAAEIKTSGRYLGSNVTYNLRKLIEAGRLSETRGPGGKGAPRFAPTASGAQVREIVGGLFERQASSLKPLCSMDDGDVRQATAALSKLERYWTDQVRFRM
jgi:DNA-binding MarR family transcriptional regulator